MSERYYLGVDVGTGSARAGIFDVRGVGVGMGVQSIETWQPETDHVEQSSEDIWRACGVAVAAALQQAGIDPGAIAGMGFDATCSLVALDGDDRPVTVSRTGSDEQNVIVWMDHRAMDQSSRINATGHAVLKYVGGVISPEMQTPKLLWLKETLPKTWQRAAHFFDLPDFLTYRATGVDTRSLCSTVCKWTYLGHEGQGGRYDSSFFTAVGLEDLIGEGQRRIGTVVRPMGEHLGGLTGAAAKELGLRQGTPVGVSIIDAHAGGLGVLGAELDGNPVSETTLEERLALIGGTSSCHMAVSRKAMFPPGIWGPYFSAMIPGMWLTEGGQSATGALIDHVISSHSRGAQLQAQANTDETSIYELLNARLDTLSGAAPPATLTRELHVLPYFHGNRSPRADPTLRGMLSGLKLTDSLDSLALLYLATIQAIAHGTRHIIDTMNGEGFRIRTLMACGGGTKNRVFLREHADITGCRIVLPRESEAVLLGSAVLGAVAAGDAPSVISAMHEMNAAGSEIQPAAGETADYHRHKHAVFQRMHADQLEYKRLMSD